LMYFITSNKIPNLTNILHDLNAEKVYSLDSVMYPNVVTIYTVVILALNNSCFRRKIS